MTEPPPTGLAKPVVLIYSDDPGEGGVSQYNLSLAAGLQRIGYTVTIARSIRNDAALPAECATIRQIAIPFDTRLDPARNLTDVATASCVIGAARPDVVIFTNCAPVSQVAATVAAANLGIPYVIVEGFAAPYDELAPQQAWMLHYQRLLYEKSRAVVAVSEDNLAILRSHYGLHARKGEVVHYGRPDVFFAPRDASARSRLRAEFSIPDEATVCLTTARFTEVKGFALQVEAFCRLADRPAGDRLFALWAGEGPLLEPTRQAVEAAGLAERIRFLGQRSDVSYLLDAADLFILPSYHEGMPLAVTEAMAKGLPVAASRVSGIPEQLGEEGLLLPDPKVDPTAMISALVTAIEHWVEYPAEARAVGCRCRDRAKRLFREDVMLDRMRHVVERALLPSHDYVSPGMRMVRLDAAFPNLTVATPATLAWEYLRDDIPHANYIDRRMPGTGFLNRDEAMLLHTISAGFRGRRALEIGCWLGWSAAHMAAAGVLLDVIDPVLANPAFLSAVTESLTAAGLMDHVTLHATSSPAGIDDLGRQGRRWSLFFIDGNHEAPHPLIDTATAIEFAEPDAAVVFHDLASPDVAQAIEYLRVRRWNVRIFHTAQVMGMAWRGAVQPPAHVADPRVTWPVPKHLRRLASESDGPLLQKGV